MKPCTKLECSRLNDPPHGFFLERGPKNESSNCSPGLAGLDCYVGCNKGFQPPGGRPTIRIRCGETGTWSNPNPECVKTVCLGMAFSLVLLTKNYFSAISSYVQ